MEQIQSVTELPRGIKPEARSVIEAAIAAGWRVSFDKVKNVTIHAPHPHKKRYTFRPGMKSMPAAKANILRDIGRLGDSAALDTFIGVVAAEEAGMMPQGSTRAMRNAMMDATLSNDSNFDESAVTEKPVEKPHVEPPRHIVSKRPMLAQASEGKAYESKVAEERHWSDGTVDYKCMSCSFTSEKRNAVGPHQRTHINRGEKDKEPHTPDVTFKAEVPLAYHPRQSRIDALAQVLKEVLWGVDLVDDLDPGELALKALTWVHEQTRGNTEHSPARTAREDMTAEEILNQIRTMLGADASEEQAAEIANLQLLNTQLTTRLTATEDAYERCSAELAQLKGNLSALTELIASLEGDKA